MHDELDEREKIVLHTIVTEYINSSEPVGSRNVSKVGPLKVSPATIRNIMGDLEDKGYLVQPHTSAGRVPTDLGYRYYIDHLVAIDKEVVSGIEDTVQQALDFTSPNMPAMMKEFSRRLSTLTNTVGFVMSSPTDTTTVRQIELVRLYNNTVLAIIVSSAGLVQNVVLDVDPTTTNSDLTQMSNYMNAQLKSMNLKSLYKKIESELVKSTGQIHRILSKLSILENEMLANAIYFEGTSNMLNFPEFHDTAALKSLLNTIDERQRIADILESCMDGHGVQIFIGSEIGIDIEQIGLITSTYKKDQEIVGMVGVIGPKRMEYGKMISVVNYSSQAIEQIIEQMQGGYSEERR